MNIKNKVDINTAPLEELAVVRGIGPVLAQKIIDLRPFSDLDDLKRVPGIGTSSLELIKPNLTFHSQELPEDFQSFVESIREETKYQTIDTEGVVENEKAEILESFSDPIEIDDDNEPVIVEFDPEEKNIDHEIFDGQVKIIESDPGITEGIIMDEELGNDTKSVEVEVDKTPHLNEFYEKNVEHENRSEPIDKFINRSQLIWSLIGTAVFSIILTILITLGILSATNGGLRYATVTEANRLGNQITVLNDLTTTMKNDIQGIRTRLDTLETVAGRVTVLENRTDTVEEEIGIIQVTIKEISETLSTVQEEIIALQEAAMKSQEFRSGLLQLLLEIEGQPEEGK
jgi:competence protein ComEA